MPTLVLGPMLRHVTHESATIWVEVDRPCAVEVLGHSTRTFTVAGHHYALVIVEGLTPGSTTEYEVHLDDELCWPRADSAMPASCIRTLGQTGPLRVVFGSCRTAAPHWPPYTLEMAIDTTGRGVDALHAHGTRMLQRSPDEWPHLAVFLGDQVYADDSSPMARRRIADRREHEPNEDLAELPAELVGDFEEYTWLYHESWTPEIERWFFSVVPSVMIFDDHEMVDDWNISDTWVRDIRTTPWWRAHVSGGLMTYWIYQHLGNLSPHEVRAEGLLDTLIDAEDATGLLRMWADQSEEFSGVAGGYRFSVVRHLGDVRLIVVDSRNSRVLTPGHRRMVDDEEWQWVVDHCTEPAEHILIGTSLPAFVPGGMHDLQVWSEAVCDGAWGRLAIRAAEKVRRLADMEDWPAFSTSFDRLVTMLAEVGGTANEHAPSTISVLSGDIHFSYQAEIHFPADVPMTSRVHQLVNSPIRNALRPHERALMRLAMSRFGRLVGRALRRAVRRDPSTVQWKIDRGPVFENCLGGLIFDGPSARLVQEQASPSSDGQPELTVSYELELSRHRAPATKLS